VNSKAQQLAPNAPNVLVVGLPVDRDSRQFAENLLGPLESGGSLSLAANDDRIGEFEQEIQRSVAAFVFFQPADTWENYPGWSTVLANPLSSYALPGTITRILIDKGGD